MMPAAGQPFASWATIVSSNWQHGGDNDVIISSKTNLETPQPDKHCPPPGSLFRFPPEFWNRAKQTLWYWPEDICILGICRLFWNTATDSEILDGYQILTRGYLYLGYLHVGQVIMGVLILVLDNGWISYTDQGILVSWVSACGPPHQGYVKKVDCLAVGHRQATNWTTMEAGKGPRVRYSLVGQYILCQKLGLVFSLRRSGNKRS